MTRLPSRLKFPGCQDPALEQRALTVSESNLTSGAPWIPAPAGAGIVLSQAAVRGSARDEQAAEGVCFPKLGAPSVGC
jgi:hypothetical protein